MRSARHRRRSAPRELVDVHVKTGRDHVTRLSFEKQSTVKALRIVLSIQASSELADTFLFHDGELLSDETRIGDLESVTANRIELDMAPSPAVIGQGLGWRGSQLYPFVHHPVSSEAVEMADSLYHQDQREKPRRLQLISDLLPRVAGNGKVPVIMAFNAGFSSMFLNWAGSCDRNNIPVRDRAIIFAMDKESRDLAQSEGFSVCYDEKSDLLRSIGKSSEFGDDEFTKHMFYQNTIIHDMLELGRDFLFQDVDLVWLEDPFVVFDKDDKHDIEFMYDGDNPFHAPLHANTGFVFFRNRPVTREFWDIFYRNYDRVIQFQSQQSPMNRYLGLLHGRGLKINILPEELFANGHLFYSEPGYTSRLPDNPRVIHCSWTKNIEQKIRKYKLNDLWYLDD